MSSVQPNTGSSVSHSLQDTGHASPIVTEPQTKSQPNWTTAAEQVNGLTKASLSKPSHEPSSSVAVSS